MPHPSSTATPIRRANEAERGQRIDTEQAGADQLLQACHARSETNTVGRAKKSKAVQARDGALVCTRPLRAASQPASTRAKKGR